MTLEELYRFAIDHGCEPSQTHVELAISAGECRDLEPSKIEINTMVTGGGDLLTIETW
jgi:hypothetical protein